jgi:hypothetical protein
MLGHDVILSPPMTSASARVHGPGHRFPGVRFADGPLPCEGEVEIRRVPEPAEYATLSPDHTRTTCEPRSLADESPARRRSICAGDRTHGRLAACGN